MKKRALAVLLTALMSFIVAGLFVGCVPSDNQVSDVIDIQRFKQTTSGLEMTNYQVVFKQTPAEWNALSTEEREKLAKSGYEQAIEKMKGDGVSNYNVIAQTTAGESPDGTLKGQIAFFLDRENSVLQIYAEPDSEGLPHVVAEVPIELP